MEWPAHLPLVRGGGVSPEKFQFMEKGQNLNFDYKNCNFG